MIEVEIKGVALSLETAPGLFSPRQADNSLAIRCPRTADGLLREASSDNRVSNFR